MNITSADHRQQNQGDPDNIYGRSRAISRQTWMVSFADLMAILLTFMVVSFSTKELNEVPWQDMSRSMQAAFGASREPVTSTNMIAPIAGLADGASNQVLAGLITDRFPALESTNALALTAQGLEIDLAVASATGEGVDDIIDYLVALNRSLLVEVAVALPAKNPGSIQRTLAWERGLRSAFELQQNLLDHGLERAPHVTVNMTEGGDRTKLVIEPVGGRRS